jgi:branched-chain amino acid transport system ATP-binding protein
VFPHLTVLENVRIALQRRKRGDSFDFWRSEQSLRALDGEAMQLVEAVGLKEFAGPAGGRALLRPQARARDRHHAGARPGMLLLDEPMAGMSHEDVDRIAALIREVAKNRPVLMVEHNLSVVASLSDRITVLARGQVLAEGDYAAVSKDPRVIEAYIGSGHG